MTDTELNLTLEEWKKLVESALQDPSSGLFMAFFGKLMIMGGNHAKGHYWCWCQPYPVTHGDHVDYEHRSFPH